MKCPNCDNEVRAGQGFCNLCGTQLRSDESNPEPSPVEAATTAVATEPAAATATATAAPAKSGGAPVVPIVVAIVVVVAVVLLLVCCLCLAVLGLTGLCAAPMAQTRLEPTRVVVVRRTPQPAPTRIVGETVVPEATPIPRTTVSVWYTWTSPEEQAVLNEMIRDYTREHPSARLDVMQVPPNDLDVRFQAAALAGQPPAILISNHDRMGNLADQRLIRPLDDLAPAELVAQMNPVSIKAVTYDGQLYALPMFNTCVALYYNKDLLGNREPPRTVDEMLAMAKDVAPRNGYGLVWNSLFFWSSGYLGGFGAQVFDDDYKCVLDQGPGAVDFLTSMKAMKDTPGVLVDGDVGNNTSLFAKGQAAMINDGIWQLSNYQESLGQDQVGVTVLPAATDPATPFLAVECVYISAGATDEQAVAAASFVSYLLAPEQSQRFAEQFTRIPASMAVDLHAYPARMGFMEQVKTAVPVPAVPEMGAVWTACDDMINRVLNGNVTPEQAVAEAVKRINEINKK